MKHLTPGPTGRPADPLQELRPCPTGPALRLLCDAMLGQLGHWLRAAGYDTLIAMDRTGDRALLARAIADGRILLTRDRKLMEINEAKGRAILLRNERLEPLAAETTSLFRIDWRARPFSRCLVCNLPLTLAPPLARERLPASVLASVGEINYCRQCDKLYWAGGHVRRMMTRLERWHRGEFR